jgi:hypothetical protein
MFKWDGEYAMLNMDKGILGFLAGKGKERKGSSGQSIIILLILHNTKKRESNLSFFIQVIYTHNPIFCLEIFRF